MKNHKTKYLLCALLFALLCSLSGCALTELITPNYTLSFDAEGYEEVPDMSVPSGKSVALPVLNVSKTGYSFGGWEDKNGEVYSGIITVKKDLDLRIHWKPNKFAVTFVVEGVSTTVFTEYGSLPVFPGTPTKSPTATKQFVFAGWEPALIPCTGRATYTATFDEEVRRFTVAPTVSCAGACTVTPASESVVLNGSATFTATVNPGYTFRRWEKNGVACGTELSCTLENVAEETALVAVCEPVVYPVTYVGPAGAMHANPLSYDVTMGTVPLTDAILSGHYFYGWYTQPDGKGTRVTTLNYDTVTGFGTLYAHFAERIPVRFYYNGALLDDLTQSVVSGGKATEPLFDTSSVGMSAFAVDGWYVASDLSGSAFNFTATVTAPLSLHAKLSFRGNDGFAPYLDKFNTAMTEKTLNVSSEDELVHWIEYCEFYPQGSNEVDLEFKGSYNPSFASDVKLGEYMQSLFDRSVFPNGAIANFSYTGSAPFRVTNISVTANAKEGTLEADPERENTYTQYEYALLSLPTARDGEFEDFPIENVAQTVAVKTSNQLVYALETGLRPLPVAGSSAERVYACAKSVLRKICNDEMSDFEKVQAIYTWLICNVQYDHGAADNSTVNENWKDYDSWYPEGVFFKHKAVCDGYARAFLIMARIENLSCIRVSGLYNGGGHAWNKVFVGGSWYHVDATHGDLSLTGSGPMKGEEYLTFADLLVTDAHRSENYVYDETAFVCTGEAVNPYQSMTYGNGENAFDLYVNSAEELKNLADYVKAVTAQPEYYVGVTDHTQAVFEIALDKDSGLTIEDVCKALGIYSYSPSTADGGFAIYRFATTLGD